MGRQLVLFDLDGTLIDGSSERTFWRYLAARGYQTPRHLRRFAAALWRDGRALRRHAWRVNKSYLAGFSCADVERLAADFVSLRLTRAVHQPALARLRLHQAYGDTVVLLTGTLQPIADALAYAWDVEHVCATICAARDGEYCAEPPLRHPFGSDKLRYAEAIATALRIRCLTTAIGTAAMRSSMCSVKRRSSGSTYRTRSTFRSILERFEKGFDKDKEIVVYCASYDCDASPKAAAQLENDGFQNVVDYEGASESGKRPGTRSLPRHRRALSPVGAGVMPLRPIDIDCDLKSALDTR